MKEKKELKENCAAVTGEVSKILTRKKKTYVNLEDANGQICGTYVYAYPPGIPILVPGERLTKDIITFLEKCLSEGLTVQGISRE